MISIIISSYKEHYFKEIEKNISATCGVAYEIIRIENPGLMGICQAYNMGAGKSKYDILLFLHEDIAIHTNNWGRILEDHLSDEKTGIVGVAGGNYVPAAPCGWASLEQYDSVYYLQNTPDRKDPILYESTKDRRTEVKQLDGMFLAMSKKTFEQNNFADYLTGFHGYDLDICLRVTKKKQNFVVNDILIEHFSQGSFDDAYFKASILVRRKNNFNCNHGNNPLVEKVFFDRFYQEYFKTFGISKKNLLKTLLFLPWKRIGYLDIKEIFTTYYKLLRYRQYYIDYHGYK